MPVGCSLREVDLSGAAMMETEEIQIEQTDEQGGWPIAAVLPLRDIVIFPS